MRTILSGELASSPMEGMRTIIIVNYFSSHQRNACKMPPLVLMEDTHRHSLKGHDSSSVYLAPPCVWV